MVLIVVRDWYVYVENIFPMCKIVAYQLAIFSNVIRLSKLNEIRASDE